MTKEPIHLLSEEILIIMNVKSHKSSRGKGFKLYYESILDEDSTNLTPTMAPDLCKLLKPCGVGGLCRGLGEKDFYCECAPGQDFTSFIFYVRIGNFEQKYTFTMHFPI